MTKADIIMQMLTALKESGDHKALQILQKEYPHVPPSRNSRQYTPETCLEVFARDGFIDRYSGNKLLFPGILRLLSLRFPEDFPYHPHWKMDETHIAYWELYPTIDHLQPVTRSGEDVMSNYITTSQLRNSAKAHWTIDELGWKVHPPGDLDEWDGLMSMALEFAQSDDILLKDKLFRKWHKAAMVLNNTKLNRTSGWKGTA